MSQAGFYYWRGRPLQLFIDKNGKHFVKLPRHLADRWINDQAKGWVRL